MTKDSFADFLNSRRAEPVVEEGKVVTLVCEGGELTPEDYERLRLVPGHLGYVDAHPEGYDRGGYVPVLANGCWYDAPNREWHH